MANEVEYWSEDRQFGLIVTENHLKEIQRLCQRACPHETGGILIGSYTDASDCAVVTEISSAPSDSRSGKHWFLRGIRGLQARLDRLWRRNGKFYLGEWHFHPFGTPNPSPTDIEQMREISESEQYHCPEPVLLILGGDPHTHWRTCAYVLPLGRKLIEMKQSVSPNPRMRQGG